jgi:hypothetical protein
MPLILGLATIAAAPTVQATAGFHEVDIIDSEVDVNEDGFISASDDLDDVILWCNDAAPVRVDIINGFVDLDEDGVVGEAAEDLGVCDLNDENNNIPSRNQVTIRNGQVDVDEDAVVNEPTDDDIANVQLFILCDPNRGPC